MVRVVGIDPPAIGVGNLARSQRFCDKLLGAMGSALEWEFDHIAGWNNKTMFRIDESDAKATVVDSPADHPDRGEGHCVVFLPAPDRLEFDGMFFREKRQKAVGKRRRKS